MKARRARIAVRTGFTRLTLRGARFRGVTCTNILCAVVAGRHLRETDPRYRASVYLSDFNSLDEATARDIARVWAAVPAWVDAVVAGRPYASIDMLTARATELAKGWGPDELGQALSQHPRIGEKAEGAGAEATASRREQSTMTDADPAVVAAITAGNAAYERRFDRVFLIRAAGRTPDQILGELQRRLANDDEAEVAEACAQLAEIALLRLRGAIDGDDRIDREGRTS
ncbi:hypothetical protein GCM10009816_06970 [Microbacterium aquimaris]|nr:2-oxo-4-hydroxy-4-carboxy-5-ureidoimidazoline decarboxylase [Microbacterium aquimaris]